MTTETTTDTTRSAVATFRTIVLDCREPGTMAAFYSAVLGLPITEDDPEWHEIALAGGVVLAFQLAPDHIPPVWPSAEHPQQMHLDLFVTDLDAGEAQVLELGARRHDHQPGTNFRVYLDPAGHPFCLCRS